MGKNKKGKGEKKQEKMDVYQRLCFLFEAGYTLLKIRPSNAGLISLYGQMITMLAKKNLCKLHPCIKRHICKKCHMILRPGVSSKVMLKSTKCKRKRVEITCLLCSTKRSFISNPDYKLFIDKHIEKIRT